MNLICGDNRFEIIERAKKDILTYTNIESSEEEMKVLDTLLYRCWQMGWLKEYEDEIKLIQKAIESVNRLRTEYDTPKERLRMDFIEDALRRL